VSPARALHGGTRGWWEAWSSGWRGVSWCIRSLTASCWVVPTDSVSAPWPSSPTARSTSTTRGRDVCNLLYFGVIRPFKGVEDLVRAFDLIPDEEIGGFWLTVVGETWEGWTWPRELIATSRHQDRITFADRYVDDEEAGNFLNGADVMVLPYHRSSTSGPLHVAMSRGLPVVVTRVGGLPEAVRGYEGAILVPPRDPESLRAALKSASGLRGRRFADPHSWQKSLAGYERLFAALAYSQPATR
jgi:glycosyltransferase involved in cell wall biosynthesis